MGELLIVLLVVLVIMAFWERSGKKEEFCRGCPEQDDCSGKPSSWCDPDGWRYRSH